jgi:hypothetical protein
VDQAETVTIESVAAPRFLWSRELNSPAITDPVVFSGHIFIPMPNKKIIILDTETGDLLEFSANGPVSVPLAVSESILVSNEYGRGCIHQLDMGKD